MPPQAPSLGSDEIRRTLTMVHTCKASGAESILDHVLRARIILLVDLKKKQQQHLTHQRKKRSQTRRQTVLSKLASFYRAIFVCKKASAVFTVIVGFV